MNFFVKLADKLRKADSKKGYACDFCGKEIFSYPQPRICADCESLLPKNNEKTCTKCGRKTVTEGVCLDCKQEPPSFTKGVSPFVYGGIVSKGINRLKNGERRLSWFFGEEMAKTLLRAVSFTGEEVIFVPVPLTKEKEFERGYNQAEALAISACEYFQSKGISASLNREILVKRRETSQQKHLTYVERKVNASGAYHVHRRKECQEKTLVLVDDISTTGATGNECSAKLMDAGAKKVYFLVAAALPEFEEEK